MTMLWAGHASAQAAAVSIDLDRSLAYVGEEMRVEVKIKINGRMSYERYLPPSFEGFRMLGSGMTSQNIEIVNMQVRRTESYIYTVAPLKKGSLKIGPAAVMMGGDVIRSQVKRLQVKPGASRPAPGQPGAEDDPGAGVQDNRGRKVFVVAQAVPPKVYQGQAALVTWHLFVASNLGLRSFNPGKQPTTDGFWSEDYKSPTRLSFEQRVVEGDIFSVALLSRKRLYAQKSGSLTVGPMALKLSVGQFFAARQEDVASQPLQIEVLPLPREGRPAGFVPGNVGRYDLTATLDRDRIKGGDAVTLTMTIRGEGNLRQLKVPPLVEMPGFKLYEPKVTDNLELGEKRLEYLLMPTRAGQLQVPSISVPTFDPGAGKYRVLRSRPLPITVTGPMPESLQGSGKDPRKNVIGPTVRPPRPSRALTHRARFEPLRSRLVWGLFGAPVLLLLLISGGERLRTRLRQETPRRQQRAAARRIREHLKRARELMSQGEKGAFFGEVAAAMHGLLDHKLGVRVEGLTREELERVLDGAGFDQGLCQEVLQELDNCDFARFTPAASDPAEMERTLSRAKKLLDRIIRVKTNEERGTGNGE